MNSFDTDTFARFLGSVEETNEDVNISVNRPPERPKRNKPTLNCRSCVERKTRCDRTRPSCFNCTRRQIPCEYTRIADIINVTHSERPRKARRRVIEEHIEPSTGVPASTTPLEQHADIGFDGHASSFLIQTPSPLPPPPPPPPPIDCFTMSTSLSPVHGSVSVGCTQLDIAFSAPVETPSVHYTDYAMAFDQPIESLPRVFPIIPDASGADRRPALLNLFGMNSAHPFQNYWTDTGGLVEVIAGLPTRAEADALLKIFFDAVDPVLPMVDHELFLTEFHHFWLQPEEGKRHYDPAKIALQFAIFANAALKKVNQEPLGNETTTANFYLSCCHQSLCISSYLNKCSTWTVQAMLLVCHFLVADDRVADAWSISGIAQRQVYALKLNRSPDVIDSMESQIRFRLWQAAMVQDTQLSLRLELPPGTMQCDLDSSMLRDTERGTPTDTAYLRAMWECSEFVQENICIPMSREQPLSANATHKLDLTARFCDLYTHFEEPFNSRSPSRFHDCPPRLLRQTITVASNYFQALTLIYVSRNKEAGILSDPYGAIQSAHEGLTAFFALIRLDPGQMNVWSADHARAYATATMMGTMLITLRKRQGSVTEDPQLMLGKGDFDRYASMLERAHGSPDFRTVQQKRLISIRILQAGIRNA